MLKWFLPTAVAMLFGILVLLGSLFPIEPLAQLRRILLPWATFLGAIALILGCLNVLRVHVTRLIRVRKHKLVSLLVLLSALGTLSLIVLDMVQKSVLGDPGAQWSPYLLNAVLIPGESALLALTAIVLVVAGMRAFGTRRDASTLFFVLVVVVILMGTVPYLDVFGPVLQFLNTLATGGMRGLLMGVALGITLTGLRIIIGIDRPHSDE